MPKPELVKAALAELAAGPPIVAALSGGTTGIGSYVARALATTFAAHGSKLRVYIIGRNAERAASVMAEGKRLSPGSEWRFVKATDLALISEVDRCCAEIIAQETKEPFHAAPAPKLDLLYLTHCYPLLKERSTTKEGLDAFISMTYYSRMRYVLNLLPLLTTSSQHPGHVVSCYAGGMEDGTKPGEKPIGTPPSEIYGITSVRKYTSFMKTLFFEELAERHAGRLVLTHVYPGLVDGPGFTASDLPGWWRFVWGITRPIAKIGMVPADVCGRSLLYLGTARLPARGEGEGGGGKGGGKNDVPISTKGEAGGGSYAAGKNGDIANKGRMYDRVRKEGMSLEVWEHTMKTLEGARAG